MRAGAQTHIHICGHTNTHLLLQGLQVHLSICVVDSCRWTEDFNSWNLFSLWGHIMKEKSSETHTLFRSHLHFLPPTGIVWLNVLLPHNDWKLDQLHPQSVPVKGQFTQMSGEKSIFSHLPIVVSNNVDSFAFVCSIFEISISEISYTVLWKWMEFRFVCGSLLTALPILPC